MDDQNKKQVKHVADIVGEFGWWQFHMCCFYFFQNAVGAMHNMGYAFHAFPHDYWCSDVPIDYPNKTSEMKCHKFSMPNETCDSWQFDRTQFDRSIVTEFGLVCDWANIASLTQTSYMLSYLVSGLVLSHLQDKYGRRPLIWAGIAFELFGTICCILSPNIILYVISRFFVGLGGSARWAFAVIIFENSGPKHRSTVNILCELGWAVGYCFTPLYAHLLRNYLYMLYGCAAVDVSLLVWFIWLNESPRWQLATLQVDKAKVTLRKALKMNRMKAHNLESDLNDLAIYLARTETEDERKKKLSILDLLKTPKLRQYTLIFWYMCIQSSLIYYGFSLNMSDYGGNFFVAFALAGFVELPAAILMCFYLRFVGRKTGALTAVTVILSALLAIIVVDGHDTAKLVFALIGKSGITFMYTARGLMMSELFPTILRRTGEGSAASISRIGAISGPFMKNLAASMGLWFVVGLYAILVAISGLLVTILPETKGLEIPDTIEEAEKIGSKKKKIKNQMELQVS